MIRGRVLSQTGPGRDPAAVWEALRTRLAGYLASQGVTPVAIVPAPEPPHADAPGGKFRRVWRGPAAE